MPRSILEESRLHPAIRDDRRQPPRRRRPQRAGGGDVPTRCWWSACASNPFVRPRAQAPRGGRRRPPVPRVRQLLRPTGASAMRLKMWTGWPTFPMVFVKGTLVGGAADLDRLIASGEIQADAGRVTARGHGLARSWSGSALLTLAGGLASAPGASAADGPQPCRITGSRNEVHCGKVLRPLDPARPDGAQDRGPLRGRSGDGAAQAARPGVPARRRSRAERDRAGTGRRWACLPRLSNRRDIVFVDQRGTGRSAPLDCEDTRHSPLAESGRPRAPGRAGPASRRPSCRPAPCRQESDLRFFTTTLAMQDLDAVRAAAGRARSINLVGGSYGTRAALEYQRQFPQAGATQRCSMAWRRPTWCCPSVRRIDARRRSTPCWRLRRRAGAARSPSAAARRLERPAGRVCRSRRRWHTRSTGSVSR